MNSNFLGEKLYFYKVFGLTLRSNGLLINGLEKITKVETPNIKISLKHNKLWPKQIGIKFKDKYSEISDNQIKLIIPNVANFFIFNGEHILIDKSLKYNIKDNLIETYLLGSAIGALLIQKGYLLFHGNALEKDGKAVVCLGDSGVGKSTLAYILMKNGWNLISDDLVAIDTNQNVLPGIPRIKLWQDAINFFEIDTNKLTKVAKGYDKFVIPRENIFYSFKKAKIDKFFVLGRNNLEEIHSNQICSKKDCLISLINNYYRPNFVKHLNCEEKNFLLVNKLINSLPIYKLYLPNNLRIVDDFVCKFF